MSDLASTSIPKPKNWQDFQTHTCTLFKCVLNDPHATTHGSEGQRQQGVDVYGRRDGQGQHWVGVQCKLKGHNKKVTEAELKSEVAEAKKFQPPLAEFIIVTTSPDDAPIQQVARGITQQHEKEGFFSVNVWGWQTLEREITAHPQAIEAFHPDLTPFSRNQTALAEQSVAIGLNLEEKLDSMASLFEQHFQPASPGELGAAATDRSSAADEAIEQNIHREIDGYRDLLRSGKPQTAKDLLEALKNRVWDSASARVRFRLMTNIGAALLELGAEEPAAAAFLVAIDYDPDDRIGMANVALAYILRSEPQQAIAAAEAALQRHPDNAGAAAYLISGHLGDQSVSDPFSLVPAALHESAEVLASAINFLCQRGDTGWRALALQAAEKHPDQKPLRRRAAEAVLDETVSSERFEIGGKLPDDIAIDHLRNAASVLQDLWDEARTSQARTGDTALPLNLARAQLALNDSQAAASVLDQSLERTHLTIRIYGR